MTKHKQTIKTYRIKWLNKYAHYIVSNWWRWKYQKRIWMEGREHLFGAIRRQCNGPSIVVYGIVYSRRVGVEMLVDPAFESARIEI